jgi:hypothetical protein
VKGARGSGSAGAGKPVNVGVIEAGYRSAETGRAVELPPVRGTGKGTRA